MSASRKNVLAIFKQLHKSAKRIFKEDINTFAAARLKINEEFKKNKNVTNKESIEELIKLATDVEVEIRTNVIQAKQTEPGVYRLNVTEDTPKLDNVIFNEEAILNLDKCTTRKKCK